MEPSESKKDKTGCCKSSKLAKKLFGRRKNPKQQLGTGQNPSSEPVPRQKSDPEIDEPASFQMNDHSSEHGGPERLNWTFSSDQLELPNGRGCSGYGRYQMNELFSEHDGSENQNWTVSGHQLEPQNGHSYSGYGGYGYVSRYEFQYSSASGYGVFESQHWFGRGHGHGGSESQSQRWSGSGDGSNWQPDRVQNFGLASGYNDNGLPAHAPQCFSEENPNACFIM